MPLTDTFVKNVKPSGKPAGDKHADGGGLYLLVVKTGGRYWRMDYRFADKRKTLSLGVYPDVPLAKARKRRDEARELLADAIDPGVVKQQKRLELLAESANSLEVVAREFLATKASGWSPRYAAKWIERMEKDLFPHLGTTPIASITAPMLLLVLRRVEKRGANETAHSLRQTAGQVFRYGIQTGRCERDPAGDLKGALEPVRVKNLAAVLEPDKVGELMRAIDGYSGQPLTRGALLLSALLFQRPGNIRQMQWKWIDVDRALLTIPSMEMKRRITEKINGRPHLVPLAPQALEVLEELRPLSGHGRYVFPSLRTGERPMSDNTMNAALRRLGYGKDEMSAHGFRAMARTLMVERMRGISADVIEAQLAHVKSGPLGTAYDRAEFMEQRRKMMEAWADYLDALKRSSKAPPARLVRTRQAS